MTYTVLKKYVMVRELNPFGENVKEKKKGNYSTEYPDHVYIKIKFINKNMHQLSIKCAVITFSKVNITNKMWCS